MLADAAHLAVLALGKRTVSQALPPCGASSAGLDRAVAHPVDR